MADDAALSESKREAAMLFSAAEGLLEEGDSHECLKVAGNARAKFEALGAAGRDGVVDTLHIMIDAHRLQAHRTYEDPRRVLSLATEHLETFRAEGDRRGEATMQLALSEIGTDDARLEKRREALQPAMTALAVARDLGDRRLEAKCWIQAAFVYFSLHDADKVLEAAEAALALSEELGDAMGRAAALYATALSQARRNDWDAAVQTASAARELFAAADRRCFEAGVLHTMAIWRLLQGRPKKAVPLAEQALELCRQLDRGLWAEAVVTLTLCEAQAEAGNAKAALKVARDALQRSDEAGAGAREQAVVHEALALAHLAADAPAKAAGALEAARELAAAAGAPRYESRLLLAAAAVQLRLRERDEARALLERAAELAQGAGDAHQLGRARRDLAALQLAPGAEGPEAAAETAGLAAAEAGREGDRAAEAAAKLLLALCHALQEEHSLAATACGDAEELYRDAGCPEGEAQALLLAAEVRAAEGKLDAAVQAARERLALARRLEDGRLQVRALLLLAGLLARAGRHEEAARAGQEALALAQDAEEAPLELEAQLQLVRLHTERAQSARDASAKAELQRAAKAAAEAVLVATRLGEKGPRGVALYWRAQAQLSEGRYQDAQRSAGEAEALFRNIQSDQGQGACLHLSGALHGVFGQGERALDSLERALAFAQAAKDANLEYEVSTSIYNLQRRLSPQQQQQHMALAQAQTQQLAMPGEDAGGTLEAAFSASAAPAQPKGLEPAFVRRQLMYFVKEVVAGDDEMELDSPFMEAGLDSLSSVALMSMVAKEFQMALSPSLVFDFPTVRALEDHLVEESKFA